MKLGIDFGTSRTVVAVADRGNYPLVAFEGSEGASPEWIPSLVAVCGPERRYGWSAWEAQSDDRWTILRSVKRLLEDAGPLTEYLVGQERLHVAQLLNGFAEHVLQALKEHSNLRIREGESLEVVLGVPANANTNQRFLTVEAFRSAGFHVLGMLNEPSAASIEFAHRQRAGKAPETILVYDLGGGTFDASLVTIEEQVHHVMGSEGIRTIGGDDFDEILAEMALESVDADEEALSPAAWFRLLEECRTKKESLNPNSRRIAVDFEQVDPRWGSVHVAVSDFYELARPLVEETIHAAEELVARYTDEQFDALYITGGGSELPLVARTLRERFGRRVRKSAYARAATAIGLAIQADHPEAYRISERLARHFGVWREAEAGYQVVFDPLFPRGTSVPAVGEPPLEMMRRYTPAHNIGHFRFLECTHCDPDGRPTGVVTVWDEVYFPFDPALARLENLNASAVKRWEGAASQVIEEVYRCDASGAIAVEIRNRTADYSRTYRLGHWAGDLKAVTPKRKRATARR